MVVVDVHVFQVQVCSDQSDYRFIALSRNYFACMSLNMYHIGIVADKVGRRPEINKCWTVHQSIHFPDISPQKNRAVTIVFRHITVAIAKGLIVTPITNLLFEIRGQTEGGKWQRSTGTVKDFSTLRL
jgi:hypothetical protein